MSRIVPTKSGNPRHKDDGTFDTKEETIENDEKEKRTKDYYINKKFLFKKNKTIPTEEERHDVSRIAQENLPKRKIEDKKEDLTETYNSKLVSENEYKDGFSKENTEIQKEYETPRKALSRLVYDNYIFNKVLMGQKIKKALKEFENIELFRKPEFNYGNTEEEIILDRRGVDCVLHFKSYDKSGKTYDTPVAVDMKAKINKLGNPDFDFDNFEFNVLKQENIDSQKMLYGNFINNSKLNDFYLISELEGNSSAQEMEDEVKSNNLSNDDIRKMSDRITGSSNYLIDKNRLSKYLYKKIGLKSTGINLKQHLENKARELVKGMKNENKEKKSIPLFKTKSNKILVSLIAKKDSNGCLNVVLKVNKDLLNKAGLSINF